MINRTFFLILIILCIIYLFNIFSFIQQEHKNKRTYFNWVSTKKFSSKICPRGGIVTVRKGGRLGNQIWEYTSVWAVAKKTGLQPYVPQRLKFTLELLFDHLSLPVLEDISECPVYPSVSIRYLKDYNFADKKSIILRKYNVQPELISIYFQEIIKELSIKKVLLKKSEQILDSIVKSFNKPVNTFIGVHIRRTDYIQFINNKYNVKQADSTYYKLAINYFDKKYKKSIFIIVSDDPKWCSEIFDSFPNVYVYNKLEENNSPELDIAILASCNHSIIDYGTFGQWGALLAGGETIYFKINQSYSSERLSKVMLNWHTL